MLSRVAESIYWMSRYIERAENVARFIEVNHNLTLSFQGDFTPQWAPLIYTTGDEALFEEHYGSNSYDQRSVFQFLTFDTRNPNSILSCLNRARENARCVRENLTTAMWEEINKFFLQVRGAAARPVLSQPFDFLNDIKRSSHLIAGVTDATMSQGEGWHFSRIGRLLERADKTSRILDVKYFILLPDPKNVGTPMDAIQWAALLECTSALQMYRKFHGRIVPLKVADFLILDRLFPRSMHFCIIRVEESLHAVTGVAGGGFSNPAEKQVGRLKAELDYTHIDDVISQGMHQFIDRFQGQLNHVGAAIHESFFQRDPATVSNP